MINQAITLFILWCKKRSWYGTGAYQKILTSNGNWNASRFTPLRPDEWRGEDRPPWYCPFNILVHCWVKGDIGRMHDHPRWSITIVLRGKIIEETPWGSKELSPGAVVIRSRKYIHRMVVPDEYRCKTWTMFIVGRRNHEQNYYEITGFDGVRK